jgi:enediyne biosynthesis protein E4
MKNNRRFLFIAIRASTAASLFLLLAAGCSDRPPADARNDPNSSHGRMIAELERIASETDTQYVPARTPSVAELTQQARMLPVGATGQQACELLFSAGEANVQLGDLETGIDFLVRARDLIPSANLRPVMISHIYLRTGVAYMRLGQVQNDIENRNPDSAILPIQKPGQHRRTEGMTQAIEAFETVLRMAPENSATYFTTCWLLNFAHMSLGSYPDLVPDAFRMPTHVFTVEESGFPRFVDIAPVLGLDTISLGGGVLVDDFNSDGYLDIITSTADPAGQMRFFLNTADGRFEDQTKEAGLLGLLGGINLVQTDYNNDGARDILVLRASARGHAEPHPNSLLRNNGDGTFNDVTFDAGLGDVHYRSQTGAWADYDNDGDLDLFVGNNHSETSAAPCQLFRNNGKGRFTDVAESAGVANNRNAASATWGDINGDRYPDLYVSNDNAPNRLYLNSGDGTFTDVTEKTGVGRPVTGAPTWFWDYDNDGALDLFVASRDAKVHHLAAHYLGKGTEYETASLYRGSGKGTFVDVTRQQGLAYPMLAVAANVGDLNNDGYLDVYAGTGASEYESLMPNMSWINLRGTKFLNLTMSTGLGHVQKGRGIAFADLDNDGDVDVFEQMGGELPGDTSADVLYENTGFRHHWICIDLVGKKSNRAAIGARIELEIEENGKTRSVFRHVNSGGSQGANPLRQTIGIGKAERIQTLRVFWPTTGRTQTFQNIAADQFIEIVEGKKAFTTTPLKKLTMSENAETRAAVLLKERQQLDQTLWKDELLAQEYEQVFVELWDTLRAADDKLDVMAQFPFTELILGSAQAPQPRELGIQVTRHEAPGRSLDVRAWKALVAKLRRDGFEIVQAEFHHAKFFPADPRAIRSTVNMTIHALNAKTSTRYIIDAALDVLWAPRDNPNAKPKPRTIDATAFKIVERSGEPAFRSVYTIQPDPKPGKSEYRLTVPGHVYDLNKDGLSDIIIPSLNRVDWNRGNWTFDAQRLFTHPVGSAVWVGVFADFTGDGQADFMGAAPGAHVLYVADAQGHFTTPPRSLSKHGISMESPMAMTAGDVDGDGDLDVWIGQYKEPFINGQMPTPYYDANDGFPAYLYRNDGNADFTDITESAGLAPKRFRRTLSASLIDLDHDLDLDLAVCSDFSGLDVYLNDGQGHFLDVSESFVDLRHSFGMSLTFADYNRDGNVDMFMTGMGSTTARRLEHMNLGREDFPQHQAMRMVMGYGNRLYLAKQADSTGQGDASWRYRQAPFNDRVARTGWSWGSTAFDFDNDGDRDTYVANGFISKGSAKDYCTQYWCQDIYMGSSKPDLAISELQNMLPMNMNNTSWNGYEHNVLLMAEPDEAFLNVAFLMDAAFEFDSRSVISDDLNGDGRMDLVVFEFSMNTDYAFEVHVLENRLDTGNHWIGVRLEEEPGGHSALGATVVLRTAQGTQSAKILSGDSYQSQHAAAAHFGLGSQTQVDELEVIWSDGVRRTFTHPKIDTYHRVKKLAAPPAAP